MWKLQPARLSIITLVSQCGGQSVADSMTAETSEPSCHTHSHLRVEDYSLTLLQTILHTILHTIISGIIMPSSTSSFDFQIF